MFVPARACSGLRSVATADEQAAFDLDTIHSMAGRLPWPNEALEDLDAQWSRQIGRADQGWPTPKRAFKIRTGQLLLPFVDLGLRGCIEGRKHALVLQGDPRYEWDLDSDFALQVVDSLETQLHQMRQHQEAEEIRLEKEAEERKKKEKEDERRRKDKKKGGRLF